MASVASTQLPHTMASQNQHTHTNSGNKGPEQVVWIIAVLLASYKILDFYDDSEKETLGARQDDRHPAPEWSV